jgi:hypothetical protein
MAVEPEDVMKRNALKDEYNPYGYVIKRPEDVAHPPFMTEDGMLIDSTDDARVNNNPSERSVANDPMCMKYRVLTEAEKAQMGSLKRDYADMYEVLNALGSSRELSIAKTKLEESCMWAVKHITR